MEKAPDAFRTISEVADELDVPQHVLRFWETRFAQIRPMKRGGGRRYYRPDDVDLLRGIRHLLYGEGYTIRGVQRLLKDNGIKFIQGVWRDSPAPATPPRAAAAQADGAEADERVPNGGAHAGEPLEEFDEEADDTPAEQAPETAEEADREPAEAAPAAASPAAARFVLQRATPQPLRERDAAGAAAFGEGEGETRPVPAGLSREDLHRLQAALYELGECRRLIEAALREPE